MSVVHPRHSIRSLSRFSIVIIFKIKNSNDCSPKRQLFVARMWEILFFVPKKTRKTREKHKKNTRKTQEKHTYQSMAVCIRWEFSLLQFPHHYLRLDALPCSEAIKKFYQFQLHLYHSISSHSTFYQFQLHLHHSCSSHCCHLEHTEVN